jgi:S1-C subfamily serine protease
MSKASPRKLFLQTTTLSVLFVSLQLSQALAQRTGGSEIPIRARPIMSAEEIARRTLPSIVMLICSDGKEFSQGSGFFIRPNVIVTNYHVIKGMSQGVARSAGTTVNGPQRRWDIVRVMAFDEDADLALLRTANSNQDAVPPLELLTNPAELSVGETVYALGNPEGLTGTISSGILSAIRNFEDGSLIQITAPISPAVEQS